MSFMGNAALNPANLSGCAHQLGQLVVGGAGKIAGHGRVAELRRRRHG
jgi:hypothetical protein